MNLKMPKLLCLSLVSVFVICLWGLLFICGNTAFAQDTCPLDTALHDTAGKIPAVVGPVAPLDDTSALIQKFLVALIAVISATLPMMQFILKRIPTAYSVKIKGWAGKLLDVLTFFQPDKSLNGVNHVAKGLLIICFLGLVGSSQGYSQGLLNPVPKPSDPQKVEAPARMQAHAIASDDSVIAIIQGKDSSTTNVIRFTVVGGYVYSGRVSRAAAGFGIAWQHLKYDYLNKRYQSQYSFGAYGLGATDAAPKSASEVVSIAGLFGFQKDHWRVGPAYHIIHQKGDNPWGVMFVAGGNFNN